MSENRRQRMQLTTPIQGIPCDRWTRHHSLEIMIIIGTNMILLDVMQWIVLNGTNFFARFHARASRDNWFHTRHRLHWISMPVHLALKRCMARSTCYRSRFLYWCYVERQHNNNMFISYSWYTIHIKGCNRATRCNKIINEKKKKLTLTVNAKHWTH